MAIIVPIVSSWDSSGLDRAMRDIKKAQGAFDSTLAGLKGFGTAFTDIGKQLSFRVTAPLVLLGKSAVTTAAEFEISMAQIGVATNIPVSGLTSLGDLAKQLGADTIFSANEAAGAMLELAKAGITPAQIEAGALANTLSLAAASGIGLAESAIIMSAGMNTFALDAENSKEIVDALAGAANASSADINDIALALQQVGQQASASGLTIQETTAGLAAFADAGVRGSDAGTSFKVFLQRLVPSSKQASESMNKLGLTFFDADGNMKSLSEIAQQLQTNMSGLTQEMRLAEMQTIFGSDALRAANILYNEGAAGIQEYIDATSASGNAEAMAQARMAGTAGALEALKGSIDTAKLAIGDALAPTIVALAGFLKNLTDKFLALSPEAQKWIVVSLGIFAALGPVLIIVGQMSLGIAALIPLIRVLGTALMFLATNPVGMIITVLGLMALGIVYVIKHWDEFKETVSKVLDAVRSWVGSFWEWLSGIFTLMGDAFKNIGTAIVDGMKTGISNAWAGFKSWFISMIGQPIEWAKQILRIASPSKVFEGIGENVVAGYIQGIDNMTGEMKNVMSNVGVDSTVAFTSSVGSSGRSSAGSSNIPSRGGTYNITVNAGLGTNGQLVGKEIVDAIKRYERSSGPVFVSA